MGFELIPGWTPEEPAPIALCDNPGCGDPIMPATGWVVASLAPPDPARSDRSPVARVYLACGDACLTALRERVGGHWSGPLPYRVYWQAIAPRVVVEPTEEMRAAVAEAEAIVRAHQSRSHR